MSNLHKQTFEILGANEGDILIDIEYEKHNISSFSHCPCVDIINDINLLFIDDDFIFPSCPICDSKKALVTINMINYGKAIDKALEEYIKIHGEIIYKYIDLPPKFAVSHDLVCEFKQIQQRKEPNPKWIEKYGAIE